MHEGLSLKYIWHDENNIIYFAICVFVLFFRLFLVFYLTSENIFSRNFIFAISASQLSIRSCLCLFKKIENFHLMKFV